MKKLLIFIISFVILCVIVTLVMNNLFTGDNRDENFRKMTDSLWGLATDDKEKEKIADNEKTVMRAMKDYVAAQKSYMENTGWYSNVLSKLDIPPEMAAATIASLSKEGYYGYLFTHVPKNGTTNMNYRNSFVLCAVPVLYRFTGIHTFAIGPKGIVLRKDNNGMPVHNATEFSDGTWKQE